MMTSSRRRDFLRAAVSALTSIGLPPALGSSAWGDASVTRPSETFPHRLFADWD
jgi:hypothetical protein